MSRTNLGIEAYVLATLPIRWWLRWDLRRQNRSPVTGIFLHRIADTVPNPWSMSCSNFTQMLDWLQENVDLVSIDEAQSRIRNGHDGKISVNISFDDGYAENCEFAIPELLQRKIPFTYYVTTQNVITGKPFPHDLKRGEPLAPISVDEIKAMHDAGVEIGCHTRTHPDMGSLKRFSEIELEIRGGRDDLANWLNYEPRHFAFPYGYPQNMPPRAIQYLYDQGFDSYCSASGGYNLPPSNAFHLRRFHGDPIIGRIRNWLSYDPRWVCPSPDFEYTPFERKVPKRKPKATGRIR